MSQSREGKFIKSIKERLSRGGISFDRISLLKISIALSDLHSYPSTSCSCGKPVVFVLGLKKFKCTRCGSTWELKMEVVQTKKPE